MDFEKRVRLTFAHAPGDEFPLEWPGRESVGFLKMGECGAVCAELRGERAAGGGTGLGLAIARWVVDLHGGRIGVVDDGRPGCRIRVTLPAGHLQPVVGAA